MASRSQIFQGKVVVWQPDKNQGYRFNIDSLLLAGFALPKLGPSGHLVELGSGSAVIGLAMLHHRQRWTYQGFERQTDLVNLSRKSIAEGRVGERASIEEQDLRALEDIRPIADVVVFNPPYFKSGAGRSSPNQGRREAREALFGDIDVFLSVASRFTRPGGYIFAVLRPERRHEVVGLADDFSLMIEEICEVRAYDRGRHQLDLICFRNADVKTTFSMTSLILHQTPGDRAYRVPIDLFLNGHESFIFSETFGAKP